MATFTEEQFKQLLAVFTHAARSEDQQPTSTDPSRQFDALAGRIAQFSYDPDANVTFEAWYRRHEDIFTVDAQALDERTRVRLLLHRLDAAAYEKYTSYILPKVPREVSFQEATTTLKDLFGPQQSLFSARFACMNLVKDPKDDFAAYAGQVNRECAKFRLAECNEDQFRCLIFVCGLRSNDDSFIRLKLLDKIESDPTCTTQTLAEECRRLLNLRHDTQMIESKTPTVQAIKRSSPAPEGRQQHSHQRRRRQGSNQFQRPATSKQPPSPCWYCGGMHFNRDCSYRQHKCSSCQRIGHKEGFCHSAKGRPKKPLLSCPSNHRAKRSARSDAIITVSAVNSTQYRKFAVVAVDDRAINFQIDTASDVTVINEATWQRIGKPRLKSPSLVAYSASGDRINFLGQRRCSYSFNGSTAQGTFYVADTPSNLLGSEWIAKLGIYAVMDNLPSTDPGELAAVNVSIAAPASKELSEQLKRNYPEVFNNGLGRYKLSKATLQLRPGAKPVFRPKRPVPYAAQPAVDKELDRLEANGVISRVNYSDWAAPIVIVRKANGSLRICADYSTGLNDALDLHQYPLPLPDDIFKTLNGGRFFSHIDFADAYLQVEMDDQSKQLLTINTHRGLYQYNRLPFGVKSAPAIFQQLMDATVAGHQGVVAYLDDVIVVGRTAEEHQRNLNALFQRLADSGLRVRPDKCKFASTRINYLGYIIDKDGRRPDPSKISAIQRMPAPKDVAQLRSFLGLLSYYGNFVKEMRTLRAPLDALLAKNAKFEWTSACNKSFNRAKAILASDLLLAHYNPTEKIVVAADASNYGIGAVISHRYPNGSEKPIAHASRSLTPAEKNYSQIEKEGLALIFAVQKFHRMIHGRRFTLLTDHKPLLAIFGSKKGIPVYTANRLQRWATTLLAYNFEIQYRSTTSFGQADALSRLIAAQHTTDEDRVIATIAVDADVAHILNQAVRALPVTTDEIKQATTKDKLLQSVKLYIQRSWPSIITDSSLQCFYNRRDSLSTLNGCLLLAERVVIPATLQQRVLRQLHYGHPGIVRMKALARSYAYWPGIDKDIEDTVRRCNKCNSAAKDPIKTTLASWPLPDRPWSRIHVDYAGPLHGTNFLVIVDAYSKWPEIFSTDRTSTAATIALLQQTFARYGIPETLVSDNGTQFASAEFSKFCLDNGIKHVFSPPYHPQSNGQAERFVDTFKRSLLKLRGEGTLPEILQTFLLTYRSTPHSTAEGSKSPAELFMGRTLRTTLSLLKPTAARPPVRNIQIEQQFNRQHGAKSRMFKRGDLVAVRKYEGQRVGWTNGKILRRIGHVLYKVLVGSETWTRHANQLRRRIGDDNRDQFKDMDTLFEMFDLARPQQSTPAPYNDSNVETTTHLAQSATQPRRSTRTRKRTRRISIDPNQKTYGSRSTNGES